MAPGIAEQPGRMKVDAFRIRGGPEMRFSSSQGGLLRKGMRATRGTVESKGVVCVVSDRRFRKSPGHAYWEAKAGDDER